MSQFFAFDHWDGLIRVAKGELPDLEVRELDEADLDAFKELLDPQEVTSCLATEESRKLIQVARNAGFEVQTVSRPLAICWASNGQTASEPSIVVSIGFQMACAWLVNNGKLEGGPVESADLSVEGLWNQSIAANPSRQQLIEAYSRKHAHYQDQLLRAVGKALKTGQESKQGPIKLRPPLDFTSSLGRLKEFLSGVDPQSRAKRLLLSDWAAAHCNIQSLLQESFRGACQVLSDGPQGAFSAAVRGLAPWAEHAKQPPPVEKVYRLELAQTTVKFSQVGADDKPSQSLSLKNSGTEPLDVRLRSDQEWLASAPDQLSCQPGQERSIAVGIDGGGLAPDRLYPGELSLHWRAGEAEKQKIIQVTVKTAPKPVLCCASPPCAEYLVTKDSKTCPLCGEALQPPTIESWLDKRVQPCLEQGPVEFLDQIKGLLDEAAQARLDGDEAHKRLQGAFKKETGATPDVFRKWLREEVEPAAKAGSGDLESRQRLLAKAKAAGIRPECARTVVEKMLPKPKPARPQPKPPLDTAAEPERKRRTPFAWGVPIALILVLSLAAWQYWGSNGPGSTATTGNLIIRTNVPASAMLDGFITPKGSSPATVLEFQGLDARTHDVLVWSKGYRSESRKVTIVAGDSQEVTIELRRE